MLGVFIAVEAECAFQTEFCKQCNGKFVDKFTMQCCDDMTGPALAAFIRLSGFPCQFYDSITKLTEPQTKASVFMELRNIMRHRALVYINLPNLFVAMDALKINIKYPLLVADKFRHIQKQNNLLLGDEVDQFIKEVQKQGAVFSKRDADLFPGMNQTTLQMHLLQFQNAKSQHSDFDNGVLMYMRLPCFGSSKTFTEQGEVYVRQAEMLVQIDISTH